MCNIWSLFAGRPWERAALCRPVFLVPSGVAWGVQSHRRGEREREPRVSPQPPGRGRAAAGAGLGITPRALRLPIRLVRILRNQPFVAHALPDPRVRTQKVVGRRPRQPRASFSFDVRHRTNERRQKTSGLTESTCTQCALPATSRGSAYLGCMWRPLRRRLHHAWTP